LQKFEIKNLLVRKDLLIYGISLFIALILLKWLESRFIIIDQSLEIYVALIAVLFTGLGIWLALQLVRPKNQNVITQIKLQHVEVPPVFTRDEKLLRESGLSKRELEVLELMAKGLSNQEISEKLFVSLNTVKTHVSNVLDKLEVRRRTQAIEKARRLGMIR
jgi:ATP/maltotriose-dependent transcriptional regulator MalT